MTEYTNYIIRPYAIADKQSCLDIFSSNCPAFFDESEYAMFQRWLQHQEGDPYSSPTYNNALSDYYFVIEDPQKNLLGCGGYYVLKDKPEASLAWGMIHASYHQQKLGTALTAYRIKHIQENFPGMGVFMCTSQHTFPFYEKFNFKITQFIPNGFGPNLDRYDMILHPGVSI